MHRPIGITILALLAGLAGVFQVWRALVFLGVVSFEFVGKRSHSTSPVGPRLLGGHPGAHLVLGRGRPLERPRVRMAVRQLHRDLHRDLRLLRHPRWVDDGGRDGRLVPCVVVLFYLNYPGVRDQFIEHEMALMTPEQRAAFDQMQAAQVAMAQASATAAAAAPPASTAAPAAPPPTPEGRSST